MKTYNIPKNVKGIIFDIDCTLYTNVKYVFEQVDVQVRYYARLKNISVEEARNKTTCRVSRKKEKYWKRMSCSRRKCSCRPTTHP